MIGVQPNGPSRFTSKSVHAAAIGTNPVLYCQKLVSLPIPKWISSACGSPTSRSENRTRVMPAASQSPA